MNNRRVHRVNNKSSHYRNNRSHTSSYLFRHIAFLICCILLTGGIFTTYGRINSRTSVVYAEENLSELKYKVVEIQKGDSLWSIAEDNMTPGFDNIKEYINEIKECNQLTSDSINQGSYLMIPYYQVNESVARSN